MRRHRRWQPPAFAIRIGNGGVVFLSQVLLARWMGASAFGTYVYVWTLLLVAADIVHIGLPLTAQRFVPEYRETGALALLRGYLHGSCWLTFGAATLASVAGAGIVYSAHSLMEPGLAGALYLACAALPLLCLDLHGGRYRSFIQLDRRRITTSLCDPPSAVYWLHRRFALGWPRVRCDAGDGGDGCRRLAGGDRATRIALCASSYDRARWCAQICFAHLGPHVTPNGLILGTL